MNAGGNVFEVFCSQRDTQTGLALIPGVDEYEIVK